MSRLYLVIVLVAVSSFSFGQSELKKYLKFAQQKYEEGDYVYALNYYDKVMEMDSTTIDILWGYAETLRAYKDYPKAAFYYGKVYEREGTELYPYSLLYYGLMVKQTGNYDKAIDIFKTAKKKYRGGSKNYLQQKARQELESTIWAKANTGFPSDYIFETLPEHINTPNAEFAHRVHEGQLIFSSLRADSISAAEEVYDPKYRTHLFRSEIQEEDFGLDVKIMDLNFENASTGNGSYSLDGKRFYFSYCGDDGANYKCKILVAYVDGDRFNRIDTLGEIINKPGSNTTMPFIGEWDGQEVLFYSSDCDGGKGGMDIWYSFIKNGNQFSKPKNNKKINSPDNELSPFWDGKTQTLYFSSSWFEGFGGYDVFKSTYTNEFSVPVNMQEPINSPANDLYYFQTVTGDTAFFSSNRLGSNYSKNPTCCSDIYMVRKEIELSPELPPIEETLTDLNLRLPVTLYFHNDIPNPRSRAATTNVNYIDSYHDYIGMIEEYKKEYSKGLKGEKAEDAKDDIEDFFTEYVKQGVKDLELFRDLLLVELNRGRKIEMTVKGFASPLAQTDYNVNLTKRRIGSLVNYLRAFNGGVFVKYLDKTAENGGELRILEVAYGEYSANQLISDNPNDKQNSVYSRYAALERKIEIQSVDIIREDDTEITLLTSETLIQNAGKRKKGENLEYKFVVRNTGEQPIEIDEIKTSHSFVTYDLPTKNLKVGESTTITVSFNTETLLGHQVISVELFYNELPKGLVLSVSTEVLE